MRRAGRIVYGLRVSDRHCALYCGLRLHWICTARVDIADGWPAAAQIAIAGYVARYGWRESLAPQLANVNRDACRHIAASLGDVSSRTVVEIGPGHGAITDLLAPRCARLHCIEFDPALLGRAF